MADTMVAERRVGGWGEEREGGREERQVKREEDETEEEQAMAMEESMEEERAKDSASLGMTETMVETTMAERGQGKGRRVGQEPAEEGSGFTTMDPTKGMK